MTAKPWRPKTLERLDALIQNARSDKEKRILLVKKACALARFSFVEEAAAILKSVKSSASAYEPRLNAWLTLCEGLIGHFSRLAEDAIRDFRRAYAVSIASGDMELTAIASAWIAHSEFCLGNVSAVPSALVQAFTYADRNNASARSRACVVVADMYNYSGDSMSARNWYKRARDAAVDDGDLAMQGVAMFNDAAHRVSNIVLSDCRGDANEHAVMLASVSVDSIANLDLGLGVRHLTSIVPIMRAEVRTVQRNWDEAIGLFDAFLCDRSIETRDRLMPRFHAQRAYCLAMSGDRAAALVAVQSAVADSEACSDLDDLFVLHSRAAKVYECLSMHEKQQMHENSADRCLNAYFTFQAELKARVDAMVARIMELEERKSPA